jgi:hypothetical protein
MCQHRCLRPRLCGLEMRVLNTVANVDRKPKLALTRCGLCFVVPWCRLRTRSTCQSVRC